MSKPKILIQLDPDPNPSTFDSVVAIASGVDHLLTQGNVTTDNIEGLVHGAMFTRGPDELKYSALFIGGSSVPASEALAKRALACFFGPMRVSLMSDPNGCNTTAAAAVLCAENHLDLAGKKITVLAGTGPVGQRIAQIIASHHGRSDPLTNIRVCSRKIRKAEEVCEYLRSETGTDVFQPVHSSDSAEAMVAVEGADVVFAAGAAGIELLPIQWLSQSHAPKIAIDLNAVPPGGIAGIEILDKGKIREKTFCYGAIGVGGLKMKIHKRCIASLFESNKQVLQVKEIYEIGRTKT